jgi:hypothetical protein
MSSRATCAVSSFSFASNNTLAAAAVSARPKLLAGVVTQPCTSVVTSTETNVPGLLSVNVAKLLPTVGAVA